MLPDSTSALLLLSVILVHSSVLSCRIGTQQECDVAPFVPEHKLVGQGFDIVTLEKKLGVIDVMTYLSPNRTCLLCINPLQNDAYQKIPYSVLDWSYDGECKYYIHSGHRTSLSSLLKSYTFQVTNDWTFGLEIEKFFFDTFDVGGTGSYFYKYFLQKIKEDRYTFSTHSVTCNRYGFIMSSKPPLSLEFKQQFKLLPGFYNNSTKKEYRKFIQTFGTHYFRMVTLGGRLRRVISVRSCLASLNGFTTSEVHTCLSMGVPIGLGWSAPSKVPKSCISILKNNDSATGYSSGLHQNFKEVSGGNGWSGEFSIFQYDFRDFMGWRKSLKDQPDVISYSLRPLYELVPNSLQKAAMKSAIEQYLKDNAVKKSHEEPHCEGRIANVASNCCPLHASRGNLSVTIVRGWDLFGDYFGQTEGYAKMFYGSIQRRTNMIVSNNPRWDAQYNLGKVDTSLALKIEVWDQDPKYDDLLVQCEKNLIPGSHTFTCAGKHGNVEVKYTLTCDPYLTGPKCRSYRPTPYGQEI